MTEIIVESTEQGLNSIKSYVLGVDPGIDGGAVLACVEDFSLRGLISFKHEPHWEKKLSQLTFLANKAYMEQVGAMPGQGVSSMFAFGKATGAAEAAMKCGKWELEVVTIQPVKWQRLLRLKRFDEILDRPKRRAAQRREQKQKALEWYPELKGVKGDIFGAVLIARAGAMLESPWYREASTAPVPQLADLI